MKEVWKERLGSNRWIYRIPAFLAGAIPVWLLLSIPFKNQKEEPLLPPLSPPAVSAKSNTTPVKKAPRKPAAINVPTPVAQLEVIDNEFSEPESSQVLPPYTLWHVTSDLLSSGGHKEPVRLKWREDEIAEKYEIQISRSPSSEKHLSFERRQPFFDIEVLPNRRYYWRVRSVAADGSKSELSVTKSFSVKPSPKMKVRKMIIETGTETRFEPSMMEQAPNF